MAFVARILGFTVMAAIAIAVLASVAASLPDIARYFRMRSM